MRKNFLLIFFFGLLTARAVSAQVFISEIMYDLEGADTGREWIEVHNSGSSDIDLASWKFFENGTNHSLNVIQGGSVLGQGGFAVIADNATKFMIDWPDFSGILFDSAFSLSNTGESLAIKDSSGNIVDEVTYSSDQGASGDGRSLQRKDDGFWIPKAPTPGGPLLDQNEDIFEEGGDSSGGGGSSNEGGSGGGSSNGSSGGGSVSSGTGSSSGSSSSQSDSSKNTSTQKKTEVTQSKITADIIGPKIIVSKVKSVFEPKVLGFKKEELARGRFAWNFGDGSVFESGENKKVEYVYDYAGDYVVTLDYFENNFSVEPTAQAKFTAKVVDSEIAISRAGDFQDPFVEIVNNSKFEMNLSGWIIQNGNYFFLIPKNSLVLPGKKVIFSPKVTFFTMIDKLNLKLLYPNGEVANTFLEYLPLPPIVPKTKKEISYYPEIEDKKDESSTEIQEKEDSDISLEASAVKSVSEKETKMIYISGLFGLIILGASSIFFFKRKNLDNKAEEFEILE